MFFLKKINVIIVHEMITSSNILGIGQHWGFLDWNNFVLNLVSFLLSPIELLMEMRC